MAGGFESGFAVRRADGDEDAGFADFEAAETVGHGDGVDGEKRVKRRGDLSHFFKGHGFIGFVFEVEGGATQRVIADAAIESDDGAVVRLADVTDESFEGNGFANEKDQIGIGSWGHGNS